MRTLTVQSIGSFYFFDINLGTAKKLFKFENYKSKENLTNQAF